MLSAYTRHYPPLVGSISNWKVGVWPQATEETYSKQLQRSRTTPRCVIQRVRPLIAG